MTEPTDPNRMPSELTRRLLLVAGASTGLLAAVGGALVEARPAFATTPLGFGWPCVTRTVNDDWAEHVARGSAGGTDFACGYGSDVYALADGVVTIANSSTSGGRGRYIQIDHHAMGPYSSVKSESLHLSTLLVAVGNTVVRGQLIAKSGASGLGYEYGYAAHLHVSGLFNGVNSDIEPHMSGSAQTPPTGTISFEGDEDIYIRRLSTGIIGVFGADYRSAIGGATGYHVFNSPEEYSNWRNILNVYNSEIDRLGLDSRGKKFVPPAGLADVLGVDEVGWSIVTSMYGTS